MDYGFYTNSRIQKDGLSVLDDGTKLKQDILHYENILQVLFLKDILLLIFGFPEIAIKQTKHLMLVCKRWYEVTRDLRFWSQLIKKKIPIDLSNFKELYDINHYCTDNSDLKTTFRWIFEKYQPNLNDYDHKFFYAQDCVACGNTRFYYDKSKTLVALTTNTNRRWEKIHFMKNGVSSIKSVNVCDLQIDYENDEGIKWKGSGKYYENCTYYDVVPHGEGKWTFPDGSVLEGRSVAMDGVPHGKGQNDVEYFFGHLVTEEFKRKQKRIKVEIF